MVMACMGMQSDARTALLLVATLLAVVSPGASTPSATRHEALRRLHQALQLPSIPAARGHGGERRVPKAPEFMEQLQRRLAHPDGVLRSKNTPDQVLPHGARVVRSFVEQDPTENHVLRFNLSLPKAHVQVLGAELRLYRLRRPRAPLLLRVYQLEEGRPTDASAADQHRLLGVQAVRAGARGSWHVFNVLPMVREWQQQRRHLAEGGVALLVTTTTLSGEPLDDGHSSAASPVARRGRRQPLLVMYNSEEIEEEKEQEHDKTNPEQSLNTIEEEVDEEIDEYDAVYDESQEKEIERERGEEERSRRDVMGEGRRGRHRQRRHIEGILEGNVTSPDCVRRDLYVDFSDIGWDSWIIAPQGYNAFQCVGHCPYPLGPANQPTNHATVQSIMRRIRPNHGVAAPCCTPLSLTGLSIMFTDENTREVVLKVYEDMVASNCGCQ